MGKMRLPFSINIFIGITDIYKQNNSNSTIGFSQTVLYRQ